MTTDEITDARGQAYTILDDAGYGVTDYTLVSTSETLKDFADVRGEGTQDRNIDVPHRVWQDIQQNGPGTARGTLVVLDFGTLRIANFCE